MKDHTHDGRIENANDKNDRHRKVDVDSSHCQSISSNYFPLVATKGVVIQILLTTLTQGKRRAEDDDRQVEHHFY